MPRKARLTPGGMIFHVLNRGVGRMRLFENRSDYADFQNLIFSTTEDVPMRILAYCLMPNHWHLVLWPEGDNDLGHYMQRLSVRHASRWNAKHQRVGEGHVYQGRFKSFPVESDEHFYTVVRYVERNPVRASLVKDATNWKWSSLWAFEHTTEHQKSLALWPLPRPSSWLTYVNQVQCEAELAALRQSVVRGTPFGSGRWLADTAARLGLKSTLTPTNGVKPG